MAWNNDQKPSQVTTFLLLENGDFLLQEDADKIIVSAGAGSWSNDSKNLT